MKITDCALAKLRPLTAKEERYPLTTATDRRWLNAVQLPETNPTGPLEWTLGEPAKWGAFHLHGAPCDFATLHPDLVWCDCTLEESFCGKRNHLCADQAVRSAEYAGERRLGFLEELGYLETELEDARHRYVYLTQQLWHYRDTREDKGESAQPCRIIGRRIELQAKLQVVEERIERAASDIEIAQGASHRKQKNDYQ